MGPHLALTLDTPTQLLTTHFSSLTPSSSRHPGVPSRDPAAPNALAAPCHPVHPCARARQPSDSQPPRSRTHPKPSISAPLPSQTRPSSWPPDPRHQPPRSLHPTRLGIPQRQVPQLAQEDRIPGPTKPAPNGSSLSAIQRTSTTRGPIDIASGYCLKPNGLTLPLRETTPNRQRRPK